MIKVSIVIPVYNVEDHIDRCLQSVLAQTWGNIEVIIVNDCTPDDSMSVVHRIIESHPNGDCIKIINHEKNMGLSAARNTGIINALGDYIYFLDSDDYIAPNCIEMLASNAERYNVDFATAEFATVGAERRLPHNKLPDNIIQGQDNVLEALSNDCWSVTAWNKLVRRSLLLYKHLFFKEGILHEDDLWTFLLSVNSKSVYVCNTITYYYFINPNSITGKPSTRNLDCRITVSNEIYKYIIAHDFLLSNPYICRFYELLKAKYFDRIIYFNNDVEYQQNAYQAFRNNRLRKPRFSLKLQVLCLHYYLPKVLGFYYYKLIIFLTYKLLILKIKLHIIDAK